MRPLRVVIPTVGCDRGTSGIGRYLLELLEVWRAGPASVRIDLLVPADELAAWPSSGGNLRVHPVTRRAGSPLGGVAWTWASLPGWCRRLRADVAFLPAGNRRLPLALPCPVVATVHDLASFVVAGKYDPARQFYTTRVLPRLYARLDRVVTVSEVTRRELLDRTGIDPNRVVAVPNGVDLQRFRPGVASGEARRLADTYGLDGPFVLFVSRLEHPGKNHVGLLAAFERLAGRHPGLRLVFAGPDWTRAEQVHAAVAASPVADRVRCLGLVAAQDLAPLYRAAAVAVVPSLYEGFGLPVLEALACGAPVAVARAGALPEVAGDAAPLFDPRDPEDVAHVLGGLLDAPRDPSGEARRRARAEEFSWHRCAAETLAALEDAAGRTFAFRKDPRPVPVQA